MAQKSVKRGNGRTREPLIKKLPPPEFDRIPSYQMLIRGTSTKFSKEGGFKDMWASHSDREIPVYVVPPQEKSAVAWNKRFEATVNAAIDRALFHSRKVGHPEHISETRFLPVILLGITPDEVRLREHVPGRAMWEWALVNGKKVPTFSETRINNSPFYPGCTLRKELSQDSWAEIISQANELARSFGFDFTKNKKRREEYLASKGTKGFQDLERPGWDNSDAIVKPIFGYGLPEQVAEVGIHTNNGYSYLVGELVKHTMIPKIYSAIKEKLRELGITEKPGKFDLFL